MKIRMALAVAYCLLLAGCGDSYDRRNWKRRTIWTRIQRRLERRRPLMQYDVIGGTNSPLVNL